MKSIDLEMLLHSKRGKFKIMMPNSRVSTMTFTKPKREPMSFQSLLTRKTSSLEELMRLLTQQFQNWLDARMSTLDLWLRHNLFREILMDSSLRNLIYRDKLKMRMEEIESSNLKCSRERLDSEMLMTNSWWPEKSLII